MILRGHLSTIFQQATRVPVTLTIALLAVVIACFPSVGDMLQFDRAQILAGEFWRLVTGHLTHWSVEHIQWDLLMFATLGVVCELRNPRRMRLCLVAAVASVSFLVYFGFPNIVAYRGLSGIDTALFTLLAVDLLRDAWRQKSRFVTIAAGGFLAGFAVKTAYEAVTGQAFFVDQHTAGFDLLVWDHIVAAVVGVVFAGGDTCFKRPHIKGCFQRTTFDARRPALDSKVT